jgi:hypothetical protein
MDAASKFLRQCIDEGRMTEVEYDEVRLGRESSGCTPPPWKFWACLLPKELREQGLTVRDCEIYSNYPGWPMVDIAARFGLTIGKVQSAIGRTRRLLPSLQNDPSGNQGLPNLSHMMPIDSPDMRDPSLRVTIMF